MPNIVLNTAVAESFRQFADVLESAEDFDAALEKLIKDTLTEHSRIIFNGNAYSAEWGKEAAKRGLLNLKTSVDAFKTFSFDKNVALFSRHGVMSEAEIRSREEILYENYAKIINIEAQAMIEMASRDILPCVNAYTAEMARGVAAKTATVSGVDVSMETEVIRTLSSLVGRAHETIKDLKTADTLAMSKRTSEGKATVFARRVVPLMEALRTLVDEMETMTSSEYWPMPNYGDMMFRI